MPILPAGGLRTCAIAVLAERHPAGKFAISQAVACAWRNGTLAVEAPAESPIPPPRPGRPDKPLLLMPRDMPKRRSGGAVASRIALLHALAHIELNALDLAWDLIARFDASDLPRVYLDQWVDVADEEGQHFNLVSQRLADFGAAYGDLPAHDGLWQSAEVTAQDLLARLAIVPLVLEARGLDVTPGMIARLTEIGDHASAAVLERIYHDEIGHVATGRHWFQHLCQNRGLEPVATYHDLVRQYFKGKLKRPFNDHARDAAGFSAAFYEPLAEVT